MTRQHPVLLHIIIANSALRMSNSCQKASIADTETFAIKKCRATREMPRSSPASTSYKHALAAKQLALHMLQSAINGVSSNYLDATLAVILLFIDFELIDTGHDNWTYHIGGAKELIKTIFGSNRLAKAPMSPLRRFLISNCLVYVLSHLHPSYLASILMQLNLASTSLALLWCVREGLYSMRRYSKAVCRYCRTQKAITALRFQPPFSSWSRKEPAYPGLILHPHLSSYANKSLPFSLQRNHSPHTNGRPTSSRTRQPQISYPGCTSLPQPAPRYVST